MPTPSLDAFLAEVGQSQLGWPASLRWTYETTRQLLADGIPGDLVECGVGSGAHPAVMARACADAGEHRTIHLFDSFRGIPNGGSHDGDWNEHYGDGSGRLEATGVAAYSMSEVFANLSRWLDLERVPFRIDLHPGWFQASVPAYARDDPGPIAFLRLDGDLYESYLVCLEHLYDLCSLGALVVCDDLNLDGCRQALRDCGLDPDGFTPITESGDGWLRIP